MANSGNLTALRPSGDMIRDARAKHIHGLLTDERWSIRKASAAIGITHSVLASRMKGETPFLADELAELAVLLKRDPVEFYAEYLAVGITGRAPVGGGTTLVMPERGPYRARTDDIHGGIEQVDDHIAPVTPIRRVA